MKVLLDECMPRDLKAAFVGHECRTVQEMGWFGQKNGKLLKLAQGHFDVLITVDRGIAHQQNLRGLSLGLVVLRSRSTRLKHLLPLVPNALLALESLAPGEVVVVR